VLALLHISRVPSLEGRGGGVIGQGCTGKEGQGREKEKGRELKRKEKAGRGNNRQ
jgi:hypothetical protein